MGIRDVAVLRNNWRCTDEYYRGILARLRLHRCTKSDMDFVNHLARVGPTDDDASDKLFLHGQRGGPTQTKWGVMDTNEARLKATGASTVTFEDVHSTMSTKGAAERIPEGVRNVPKNPAGMDLLPCTIVLAVGARVRLSQPKSEAVQCGIVNNMFGTVIDFVSQPGKPPGVLVQVERWKHDLSILADVPKVVPMFPVTQTFKYRKKTYHRTQIPVVLGWASTVHKVQGLTTGPVVLDVSTMLGFPGATYTAFSRATRREDVTLWHQINQLMDVTELHGGSWFIHKAKVAECNRWLCLAGYHEHDISMSSEKQMALFGHAGPAKKSSEEQPRKTSTEPTSSSPAAATSSSSSSSNPPAVEQQTGISICSDTEITKRLTLVRGEQDTWSQLMSSAFNPARPDVRAAETYKPRGIRNLGDTCWLGSSLQVLYNICEVHGLPVSVDKIQSAYREAYGTEWTDPGSTIADTVKEHNALRSEEHTSELQSQA